MAVLKDKQRDQLRDLFKGLTGKVRLLMFTQEMECDYCKNTREMLEEVAALSDRIELEVLDFVKDREKAEKHGVDKIPATVVLGERDFGVRFFGVPAGYEFTTLIEDVLAVGTGRHGLDEEVLAELRQVDKPVRLQVLISPSCPVCPKAVRAAHRLAMASDMITADMIETGEFPHLVQKYDVQGVPHTMVTEEYGFVGPLPEDELVNEVLIALGKRPPEESIFYKLHQEHHQHAHEDHQHTERQPSPKGKPKKAAKAKTKSGGKKP